MIQKTKNYLTYTIIATVPIMSIINIGQNIKFNLALSDLFILLLGFVWIIDIRNFKIKRDYPYFWYFTMLFVIFLISNIYNLNSNVTSSGISGIVSEGIKFIISAIYLFVGYNSYKNRNELIILLEFWILGLWIFMIYGFYAHLSALNSIPFWSFNNNLGEHGRFLGTITDANAAGTYLTFSFFMVILFINLSTSKKNKILGYITEIVLIISLILTQSRGSWVGFFFGLICVLIFNIKRIYKFIIFAIPIGIILFFIFNIIDYDTNNIISNNFVDRLEEVVEGEGQFIIRGGLTKIALDMGTDNFILGVGRGNFILNSKPYADKIYNNEQDFIYGELTRSLPHTTFIGMFAELGILGFIAFSSIFILLFYKFYKSRESINYIFIFALLAFGIQSFGLNLENFRILWIFIGIFLSVLDKDINTLPENSFVRSEIDKSTLYKVFGFLILISFILYIYASTKITNYIKLDNNTYISNILINDNKQSLELVYYIKGSADIKIYEISNKDRNIIFNKFYHSSDGFIKMQLIPSETTQEYIIEFNNKYEEEGVLKNLYYDIAGKKFSLVGYKYLPSFIWKTLNGTRLLDYNDYNIKNGKIPKYPINFGDYIIHDIRINNIENSSEIEFDIEIKDEIKTDKIIDIIYSNNDINNMINGQNKLIQKYTIKSMTENISIGERGTYKAIFKGKNVFYDVNVNMNNKNLYIGQVNPNSISLSKYLNNLDENKLIMIAIMDEGTNSLDYESIYELKKFGFDVDLKGKGRWAYIAIGSKNSIVKSYENLSNNLIQKQFIKGDMLGKYSLPFDLNIISAGFDAGNIANIVIDGVEYSPMNRGMNIVVYDMIDNKIIDSINFDTHASIYK